MNLTSDPLYKWIVLATVSIANFSAALDMSIVVVSFPRLVSVFDSSASVVIWLVMGFSMAELGLALTLARVGDVMGRKKVYLTGLVFYTIGLTCCSLSPGIGYLIASRMIMGAGAAMALTVGGAIVVAVFPRNHQGKAIGIFGMMMTAGLIAGPALGGLLLDALDWRGLFYTRIPIGVLSIVMAMIFIKEQKGTNVPLQLDIAGAFSLLAGTAGLLLFFNLGDGWGYLSQRSLGLLAVGVAFLALFIYLERKAPQPVLDLSFFKDRVFSAASIANFFQMFSSVAGPTLAPFLLINGMQLSSTAVGMLMALIAIPSVIISPISGWLSDKIGYRLPMVFGTLTFSVALFLLSRIDTDASIRHIALVFMVFGCGMGIFNAPNQSAIVGAVPRQYLATAMGVANTTRLLAATIGTALIGTLYSGRHLFFKTKLANMGLDPYFIEQTAAVKGFQFVLLFAAGMSLLAVLASLATGKVKQPAVTAVSDVR